jgi:hypothetical protein
MTNRPSWTLSEAAERTGASRSTIRRYRETGKFPHAYKGTDKQWRVPVEDLLASGLMLSGQAQSEQVSMPTEQLTPPFPEPLSERVRELEALLAVERARAAGLERVAAAAEANAADLRMALRMIEAARPERSERAHPEQVSMPTEQPTTPIPEQGEQPERAHPGAIPIQAPPKGGWRRLLWGHN